MDTYTVKQNEQLSDIAGKFGISVEDILKVNNYNLTNLKPGDKINVPIRVNENFDYYVVKKGDTLYKIASIHNVDANTLAEVNGIKTYDYLYPDQILIIPRSNVEVYVTQLGDTLDAVAIKLGSSKETLIEENKTIYLLPEQLIVYRK